MFERIKSIVIKEFIQLLRDKKTRLFLIGPPLLQLIVFGYVVTTDVNNIRTAVYDLDHSYESREVVRRMEASGYFHIRHWPESQAEIRELLDRGAVLCVIQINGGFSRNLKKGMTATMQVIVDGTDSNTAIVAMNYLGRVLAAYAGDFTGKVSPRLRPLDIRTQAWYNPDLRSKNYNVPGVAATIIMLICLIITSMAVVKERELGTMEQLMVTPIRPLELILGKTIPSIAVGFFDMALVLVVGIFWFDIPLKGSIGFLILGTAIYLLSVLGIGLFISTISKTQQQALMLTLMFFMPAMLLSGFAFPIENMPDLFQYVTYLNPLRYFLIIIRDIFLKGNGIAILWPEMTALLIIGIIVILLSIARFRKRLA
jgi:ABC-2 type transport system permease protein